MKKKLSTFFQIFFMLILCITFSACMGMDPNTDFDDEDDPSISEPGEDDFGGTTGGISLDGVKVLRKPLTYDFEGNTPDNGAENESDYYRHFSKWILTYLFRTYGNFNYLSEGYNNILEQINSVSNNNNINILISQFNDPTQQNNFLYFYDAIRYQIVPASLEGEVEADPSKGWKWTINSDNRDYKPLMSVYGFDDIDYPFNFSTFNEYYTLGINVPGLELPFIATSFSQAFIGTTTNPSDYVDALTYAIYNLVLGVEPNEITISYDASTSRQRAIVEGFVDEGAYGTESYKSSASLALADVKAKFTHLGSYVGLTTRDKENIINYILENVIGADARETNPYVNYYYDDVVEAIVSYCSTTTKIGHTEGAEEVDDTTIGDSFMASEVVDFPYTSFFSSMEDDPFEFVQGPYEYQSFVLMPSSDTVKITDIWLDFKYDAGNDGDENVTEQSLEIEVSVRWNKGDGSPIRVVKKTIVVKDGPADVGEDGTTLEFELDTAEGFGEVVEIGKFKQPEALIPGPDDNRVVKITGFTDARKYYKVLESARYGGYGVLNEEKLEGSYLEVAFNVNKTPGDSTTNYAFYTAISNLVEPMEYPNDPEWH